VLVSISSTKLDSVALEKSSKKDVYYRNDPMKYVAEEKKKGVVEEHPSVIYM
jgi:hypothetical protein